MTPHADSASRRFHPGAVGALLSALILTATAFGQTQESGFEGGTISPFSVDAINGNLSAVVSPSFGARAGSKVHQLTWYQASYDGSLQSKRAEGITTGTRIKEEGWYAFSFYIPTSFPSGKSQIIGQMIAWTSALPSTNKTITLSYGSSGALSLNGYYGVGDGGATATGSGTLLATVTKGVWHDVIVYARFSRNGTGILRGWIDGAAENAPTVNVTGINLGNGAWTNDSLTDGTYQKWGLYCWDNANYTAGESRTIYVDEVAYLDSNPAGAFGLVKPAGSGGTTLVAETFNGMTVGSAPSGWTNSIPSGTSVTVVSTPSISGNSLKLADTSTANYASSAKSFSAQSSTVTAELSFRVDQAANWQRFFLRSGSTVAVELYLTNAPVGGGSTTYGIYYRNSAGNDVFVAAITATTWNDLKIVANPATDKADIYVNGVLPSAGTQVGFRTAVASLDSLLVGTGGSTTQTGLFVDDVTVATQ